MFWNNSAKCNIPLENEHFSRRLKNRKTICWRKYQEDPKRTPGISEIVEMGENSEELDFRSSDENQFSRMNGARASRPQDGRARCPRSGSIYFRLEKIDAKSPLKVRYSIFG